MAYDQRRMEHLVFGLMVCGWLLENMDNYGIADRIARRRDAPDQPD